MEEEAQEKTKKEGDAGQDVVEEATVEAVGNDEKAIRHSTGVQTVGRSTTRYHLVFQTNTSLPGHGDHTTMEDLRWISRLPLALMTAS